jgi:hypothetical protein
MAHARADAPLFFGAQGNLDTYVPQYVDMARAFAAKLRSVSNNPVVYAELPGGLHGFDLFYSIRFRHVVDGAEPSAGGCSRSGGAPRTRDRVRPS